jgi:hypothetical protein
LHKALKSGEIPSIVKAAQIVLDRTGFHPSQAIELTGKDGGPVAVDGNVNLDRLSVAEKVTLMGLLEKAGVSSGSEVGRS